MISTPASSARCITASRSASNSVPSMCACESMYTCRPRSEMIAWAAEACGLTKNLVDSIPRYKVDNGNPLERRFEMRIGQLAAQADVNVQTVRLYERLGLLKKPGRRASGYREYTGEAVN